jgi:molybdate transport system permease protein
MEQQWSPFGLSLWVASWAGVLALGVGLALAWLLVRVKFRGKLLLEGLVMLPLVLPPTVLGYYLLVALGQRGIGPYVEQVLGFRFVFTWVGAVVAAFISAVPLVVQTIRPSLADINPEIENAARVDGCNEFQLFGRVIVPLIWRALVGGGALGFMRALGEFGATLMVAGNIPGRTQTLSMAIYDAVQANDIAQANMLVLLLSGFTFALLFISLRLGKQFRSH